MRLEELYGFDDKILTSYKCLGNRPPEVCLGVKLCLTCHADQHTSETRNVDKCPSH